MIKYVNKVFIFTCLESGNLAQGATEDCSLFWKIMPLSLAGPGHNLAGPGHNHMVPVCPAKLLTV